MSKAFSTKKMLFVLLWLAALYRRNWYHRIKFQRVEKKASRTTTGSAFGDEFIYLSVDNRRNKARGKRRSTLGTKTTHPHTSNTTITALRYSSRRHVPWHRNRNHSGTCQINNAGQPGEMVANRQNGRGQNPVSPAILTNVTFSALFNSILSTPGSIAPVVLLWAFLGHESCPFAQTDLRAGTVHSTWT